MTNSKEIETVSIETIPLAYGNVIADEAIKELKKKYSSLTINGIEDTAGYKMVHIARMEVAKHRIAIEKKRVELKASAISFGKAVDTEAKRITSNLLELESALEKMEVSVDQEKEAIRLKAIQAEEERIANIEAEKKRLAEAEEAEKKRIEQERIDNIKKEQEAEALRLKKQNEELEKKQKEVQAEVDKLNFEKKEIENKKREEKQELERKEAEEKRLKKAEIDSRYSSRISLLTGYRCKLDNKTYDFTVYMSPNGKEYIRTPDIYELDEVSFKRTADVYALQYEAIVKQEAIEEANTKAAAEKKAREESEALENLKAERKKRLAPDQDKLTAYIKELLSVKCTPPSHTEAKELMVKFERNLKAQTDALEAAIKNLTK